jgi:regulator of sigma E protease
MQFIDTVFYFVLTLGVLVFVHEFGHFIAAKLSGMRAEVFALGMGNRLFGYNRVTGFSFWKLPENTDLQGNTDYRVAAFPIGGYVKISGMIDESFDTEFIGTSPEPWEFRAKPIWQRMIVISAGVIMNILLAVAIFWGINYAQGKIIRETTEIGFVADGSPAAMGGLRTGDRILRINGEHIEHWDHIYTTIYLETGGDDITMDVIREGHEVTLRIPRAMIPEPTETSFGIIPANTEVMISAVEPGKPADQLGLKPLDILVSLNGTPIRYNQKVVDLVKASAGKPLVVEWKRGTELFRGTTIPSDDGRIGVSLEARYTGPMTRIHYSVLEAFPEGVRDIIKVTGLSVQQIWQMVSGKVEFSKNVGGPIKIAQMATQTAELGVVSYLGFMALLSISLAVLNILPFPALDGGHLVFLIYEGIFRREIPVKIKMGLQKAGIVLLLTFMAFVVYNDIVNF